MSEVNTDNLVSALLTGGKKGYPVTADTKNKDGVVWYTQNSYTGGTCANPILTKLFKDASKSGKGRAGKAEFVIDTPDFYIVVEDKDDAKDTMFSGYIILYFHPLIIIIISLSQSTVLYRYIRLRQKWI